MHKLKIVVFLAISFFLLHVWRNLPRSFFGKFRFSGILKLTLLLLSLYLVINLYQYKHDADFQKAVAH